MGKHKNPRQEEDIIKLMEEHTDIAKGFTKGDRMAVEKLWEHFMKDLNSLGPPFKDISGWKKVWCDWKASVKKKITINKRESKATGGGPYNQLYISNKEEVIGQICGLYNIAEGIQKSNSFGPQQYNNEPSADDDNVFQTIDAIATPVNNRRKISDNENLDNQPSTSKRSSSLFNRKDQSLNDHLKSYLCMYIETATKNGKELLDVLKSSAEIQKKNNDKVEEIASNLRRVYKSVDHLTTTLTKEMQRHNKEMEKAAYENNKLKKKALEIQEKLFELEKLKNSL